VIALRSTRALIGSELMARDVVVADGRVTEHAAHGSVPWARDLGDAILAPGLIDLQVNGAFGHDITADPASLWEVAARLPEHGVTAFCPTVISSSDEGIAGAIAALADRPNGFAGAEPLGLHLEGPLISPTRHGAHRLDGLGPVDPTAWSAPSVRIVTLAPEVVPAEVVRALVEAGVVVSLGHSEADHDEAMAAFDAGAGMVTHLFNAMAPLHHREPGLAGAALEDDRVIVAMITDGAHVHPTVVRLVHRLVGRERFVAVTDAMAGAGKPPGPFALGGSIVESDGLVARLADGTLAGSVVTMNESVVRLARLAGIGLEDSLIAHSTTPARLLSEHDRGELAVGVRGDLVAIDDDGTVLLTVVAGDIVHQA
jgi:N-acetylglucosamine-6-phosphate deacetylase